MWKRYKSAASKTACCIIIICLSGFSEMPIPTHSLRLDEQQLLELAARARVHGSRRGYLHKADSKLKKLHLRWCCVYQNFLFYFESESCTKPLGVVFLEGTICRPAEQLGLPIRDVEVKRLRVRTVAVSDCECAHACEYGGQVSYICRIYR